MRPRMMTAAIAFVDGKPAMVTYPPAAAERATDGWLELRFSDGGDGGRARRDDV